MGFCWGGGQSFRFATDNADVKAALTRLLNSDGYQRSPAHQRYPVYGFYAEEMTRITASVPHGVELMTAAGKFYEPFTYSRHRPGHHNARQRRIRPAGNANHAANQKAREDAWKRVESYLGKNPDRCITSKPACDPALTAAGPAGGISQSRSFGACPRADHQRELRERMERQPLTVLHRELEGLLETAPRYWRNFSARSRTTSISWPMQPGHEHGVRSLNQAESDELLNRKQEYNACRNALNFASGRPRRRGGEPCAVAFPQILDDAIEAVLSRAEFADAACAARSRNQPDGNGYCHARLVKELAAHD